MQVIGRRAASFNLVAFGKCAHYAIKHISTGTWPRCIGNVGASREFGSQSLQSTLFNIPQLNAEGIEIAKSSHHVAIVNKLLQKSGILKIKMGFHDPASKYLEHVISGLHEYHGHGLPITHSMTRGWFWDIRPARAEALSTQQQQCARSETMEPFSWHSDCSYEQCPPRYFALQVLEHDKCGGGTLSVLSIGQLLKTLLATTIDQLCKPEYLIRVPPEFIKNEIETKIIGPVLCRDRSEKALGVQPLQRRHPDIGDENSRTKPKFHLRYRADITFPLNTMAAAALEEVRSRLSDVNRSNDGVIRLMSDLLPTGSIVLMDNGRWLHMRNEVKDVNRHLRRVRWDARPFLR